MFAVFSLPLRVNAVVPFYPIYLCGIQDPDGGDRTGWQQTASTMLENVSNSVILKKTAFNSEELKDYLTSAKMFVVHTHGSSTQLRAVDANGVISHLTKDDIDSLDSGALNNLELAYLGACSVGEGQDNIVRSVYRKGADCVIGYTESVLTVANYVMIENFCVGIGNGYSILESLAYADAQVLANYSTSGNTNQRLVLGDTSQVFADRVVVMSCDSNVGNDIVYFKDENNEIFGFFDPSKLSIRNPDAYKTQVASEISYDVLAESYLKDVCQDATAYSLQESYYTEDTGLTTYIYCATLSGVATSDIVFFSMNSSGELVSYGKPREGIFNNLSLSENALDLSLQALEAYTSQNSISVYTIIESRLVIHDGEFSVRYMLEYTVNDCLYIDEVYISLT